MCRITLIISFFTFSLSYAQNPLFTPAGNINVEYGMSDVIAADFDNDGNNDLAVADNDSYTISIFENDGSGNFSFKASYGVGANPGWIISKDFNGDGILDLVVSADWTHDLAVFWGNGDCTFQYAFGLSTDGRNGEVIAVDINNDLELDLMVPVMSLSHIAYFINNGNGTFQSVQYIPTIGSPFTIYSNDFDSDNDSDIAYCSGSNLCVMLNDGAGNFTTRGNIQMCSGAYSITGGDVDNDGDVDIVSVNGACNQIQFFINDGNAAFNPGPIYAIDGGPLDAELADLNYDGNLDIAVSIKWQYLESGECIVFLGLGDGTFTFENIYPTGQWPQAVCISDLNGDRKLDIATANFGAGTISLLFNDLSYDIICSYVPGDANGNSAFNGLDVTYSVNYFKGTGNPPPYVCFCIPGNTWFVAGDVNNSCSFNGLDVTYMVNYFKGGADPTPCADCPPVQK